MTTFVEVIYHGYLHHFCLFRIHHHPTRHTRTGKPTQLE